MIVFSNRRGFIARLVRQRDLSFHLCLTGCRLCDNKLGVYTCGRGPGQREVVAKISHSIRRFRTANADMASIVVTIPPVSASGVRAVWCPRGLRVTTPVLPMSADVSEALALSPSLGVRYVNRLADWSTELGCLVLKFLGNRVLCASSKNFMLQEESAPRSATHAPMSVVHSEKRFNDTAKSIASSSINTNDIRQQLRSNRRKSKCQSSGPLPP